MYVHPGFHKFAGGDTPGPPVGVEGEIQGEGRSISLNRGEGLLPGSWEGWTPLALALP